MCLCTQNVRLKRLLQLFYVVVRKAFSRTLFPFLFTGLIPLFVSGFWYLFPPYIFLSSTGDSSPDMSDESFPLDRSEKSLHSSSESSSLSCSLSRKLSTRAWLKFGSDTAERNPISASFTKVISSAIFPARHPRKSSQQCTRVSRTRWRNLF